MNKSICKIMKVIASNQTLEYKHSSLWAAHLWAAHLIACSFPFVSSFFFSPLTYTTATTPP